MISFFLRAKHWQIFMVSIGMPILMQIFVFIAGIFAAVTDAEFLAINLMFVFVIVMILNLGTLFGWFWSIAIGLQRKIPPRVKMKVTKFKIFFFFPLLYITFIVITSTLAIRGSFSDDEPTLFGLVGLVIPLHLFSMFCIFYCLYFVTKTIRTAELQREVFFNDFAGDFFLIWFYPIGVWVLQPRVNKLVEG